MAKLSQRDKSAGRGFLLDLFVVGGILDENDLSFGDRLAARQSDIDGKGPEALIICKEIKNRLFDFFEVDRALKSLEGCRFYAEPSVTGAWKYSSEEGKVRQVSRTADKLAAIIADFCADNQIYWDDVNTNRTVDELEQYKQTLIGAALWNEGCFLSQAAQRKAAAATKTTSRAPRAPRTAGTTPTSGYKTSGPQSGNARGLIGQPNAKTIFPAGTTMYGIFGTNTKSSKPTPAFALVNPLEAKGASLSNSSINKVFINSSHGYTDCRCFFDSRAAADAFLQKCISMSLCPAFVQGLQVGRANADPNGYFQVETECGPVFIQAHKLNELFAQKSAEVAQKKASTPKYEIHDIATFEEAFFKYE